MEIYGLVILIFLSLLLVGIAFKLAKFVLKLASLVLLFAIIIWVGVLIYGESDQFGSATSKLYIVEGNDSFEGYALDGKNYTFVDLNSDFANETLSEYDKVYLVSYDTLKQNCVSNSSVRTCVQNLSLDTFWKRLDNRTTN